MILKADAIGPCYETTVKISIFKLNLQTSLQEGLNLLLKRLNQIKKV